MESPTWLQHGKFSHPIASCHRRAYELVEKILTTDELRQLHEANTILIQGKYACYYVMATGGSGVVDLAHKQIIITGCLELYSPIDDYSYLDRFVAVVLVLKNDEDFWWTHAYLGRCPGHLGRDFPFPDVHETRLPICRKQPT